jgi:hypothetical protein
MTHIPHFAATVTGIDSSKITTKKSKRDEFKSAFRKQGMTDAFQKTADGTHQFDRGQDYRMEMRRDSGSGPQYFVVQAGDFDVNSKRLGKYYKENKGIHHLVKDSIELGRALHKAANDPSEYIDGGFIQEAAKPDRYKAVERYQALRNVFDDKDMADSLKKLKAKELTLKVENGALVSIKDKKGEETFETLPADKNHAASKLKELIRDKAGVTARTTFSAPPPLSDSDEEELDDGKLTPKQMLDNLQVDLEKIYSSVSGKHPKNSFDAKLEDQFDILKPVITGKYVLNSRDRETLEALKKDKNTLQNSGMAPRLLGQFKAYKSMSADLLDSNSNRPDLEGLQDNVTRYGERFQSWQKRLSVFAKKLKNQKIDIDLTKLDEKAFELDEDDSDTSSLDSSSYDPRPEFHDSLEDYEDGTINPDQTLKDLQGIKGQDLLDTLDKYRQLKTDLAEYRGDVETDPAKAAADALVAKFDKWDKDHEADLKQLKELPDTIASLNYKKQNEPGYIYNSALAKAHRDTLDSQDKVTQFLDDMKDELSGLYKRCGKEDKLLSLYHPDGKEFGLLDVGAQYPVYESDLPESQRQGVSDYTKLRHLDRLRGSKQAGFHQNIQEKNIDKLSGTRQKATDNIVQERKEAKAFDNSWLSWFLKPIQWGWSWYPIKLSDRYKEGLKNQFNMDFDKLDF